MNGRLLTTVLVLLLFILPPPQEAEVSDRERDNLRGPVRRVKAEVLLLRLAPGRIEESPAYLYEVSLYDESGRRVETDRREIPFVDPPDGRVIDKKNERGDLYERAAYDESGVAVRRESTIYTSDAWENWIEARTFLLLTEGGKQTLEPLRLRRRVLAYFYDRPAAPVATPTPTPQPSPRAEPVTSVDPNVGLRALSLPSAFYPPMAAAGRVSGEVIVEIEVDAEGKPSRVRTVTGHPLLRAAAESAARRARFQPPANAANNRVSVRYVFKLPDGKR